MTGGAYPINLLGLIGYLIKYENLHDIYTNLNVISKTLDKMNCNDFLRSFKAFIRELVIDQISKVKISVKYIFYILKLCCKNIYKNIKLIPKSIIGGKHGKLIRFIKIYFSY